MGTSLNAALRAAACLAVAAAALAAQGKSAKSPAFERGKIVDGTAANGVTWHVRLPKEFDAKAGGPALLLLHGSNMSSAAYVHTVAAAFPKLAEDFVLVGIDGENRVAGSPDDNPAFNYSYVNWGGKSKYPGTKDRESPVFVTEALAEIRKGLKLTKVLVGGHSQGGFLSYSLFMNFPETFAGTFPISCGLIVQCEPTAFEDPAVVKAQRGGALAVVHARNDPAVPFSSGDAAYGSFLDVDFPALKLFAPSEGAHMFALLPVEPAVRWLDEMTAEEPAKVVAALRTCVEAKRWRDVSALLERLKRVDTKGAHRGAAESAKKSVEAAAAAAAKPLRAKMKADKDGGWAEDFLAFRDAFGLSDAAKPVVADYAARRESQSKKAAELWGAARAAWNRKDDAAAKKACEELLRTCPAAVEARYARNALKN
jgi:poly(3-hydroxybutyrate) depolymerase